MLPDEIRRLIIRALFSDEVLTSILVLKGGNALQLVLRIGSRSSFDIDFSLSQDFDNLVEVERRMRVVLEMTFSTVGYQVFDCRLRIKPSLRGERGDRTWGGYEFTFKLIDANLYNQGVGKSRREALLTGWGQERTFRIQISKFEFCTSTIDFQLDQQTVVVYTPALIAIEKLRAICQQLPEYGLRVNKRARARDFYDIHAVCTEAHVNLPSERNLELIRRSFEAKRVPLRLIGKIADSRDFHRSDWDAVTNTVTGSLASFDSYFDFVLARARELEILWKE